MLDHPPLTAHQLASCGGKCQSLSRGHRRVNFYRPERASTLFQTPEIYIYDIHSGFHFVKTWSISFVPCRNRFPSRNSPCSAKTAMEILRTPPQAASFTPLAEHQSRTPQSFYDGAPVLHYHSARCKIVILESEIARSPALRTLRGSADTNGSAAHDEAEEKETVIDGVDVWAASE